MNQETFCLLALTALFFASMNAYFLFALTPTNFLEKLDKYILLKCIVCRTFWLAAIEMVIVFSVTGEWRYFIIAPVIGAFSIIVFRHLKPQK